VSKAHVYTSILPTYIAYLELYSTLLHEILQLHAKFDGCGP